MKPNNSPVLSPHTASPWRCCRRRAPTPSARNHLWCLAAAPEWRCTPCGSCYPANTQQRSACLCQSLWVRAHVSVCVCSYRYVAGVDVVGAGIVLQIQHLDSGGIIWTQKHTRIVQMEVGSNQLDFVSGAVNTHTSKSTWLLWEY